MKNRVVSLLTAVLCLCNPLAVMQTNAADNEVDINKSYTFTTDTFTYTNNDRHSYQNGFFLESDLADPGFMVVGFKYRADDSDKLYSYIVTPINDVSSGLGTIHHEIIAREIGDQQLKIGDLLKIDGLVSRTAIYPTQYSPLEEGTMSYLGNGIDVFGSEFEKIIRFQLVIDQTAYNYNKETTGSIYGIELIKGDVNVDDALNILDCITINKNLLAGAPLCDYAKLAGDVNGNNMIDAADSLAILKETIGLTENFE